MATKKLNIVFLDLDDIKNPLLGAGQAKATYEVARRFTKNGHSVRVLCSKYPGSIDRVQDGIQYRHIGMGTPNIKVNNAFYILTIPLIVPFIKADIIFECFTAPISTLFSPIFTKIPVVVIPSSFEADRFSKTYHLPFNLIEKVGARFYRFMLPYSEYTENKMKKINPGIVTKIVPEGVGDEFFRIPQKEPKHILFLGRFDINQKGIDLLLSAYKLISNKVGYKLVLAGKGPDECKIQAQIITLGLEDKVKVIGPAYGRKKASVLSHSVCVAFPSRDETFSLFALEALASGLPLVAFEIPGLCWTPPSSVLKAPAFDIHTYSKLLLKACDRKHNFSLRVSARIFARSFSWDNVARAHESFVLDIVEGKYDIK